MYPHDHMIVERFSPTPCDYLLDARIGTIIVKARGRSQHTTDSWEAEGCDENCSACAPLGLRRTAAVGGTHAPNQPDSCQACRHTGKIAAIQHRVVGAKWGERPENHRACVRTPSLAGRSAKNTDSSGLNALIDS